VPNNPNLIFVSVNLSLQQLIVIATNITPTIDASAFANPMGEFFQVLVLEFRSKVLRIFYSSPPFFDRRMKPSRCSIGNFSSLNRIFRAS
jgi:hypothetical protein